MDREFGDYVNHDLAQYHVAVCADVPSIEAHWIDEDDDALNPIGTKGIGEIGIVGTAAAIANAVHHATGARDPRPADRSPTACSPRSADGARLGGDRTPAARPSTRGPKDPAAIADVRDTMRALVSEEGTMGTAPWRSLRRTPDWLAYALATGLLAALYLLGPLNSGPVYNVIGASSAVAVALGAARHRPRGRGGWYLVALGEALFVAGDVLAYNYDRLFGAPLPFPSVADPVYLLMYPCMALGLLVLARRRRPARDRAGLIDALIVSIGVGTLSWAYLIAPYAYDASLTMAERVTSIAYPVMDLLLLGVAVRLLLGGSRRSPSAILLGASLVALLGADAAYGWFSISGGYDTGGLLDGGWIAFYVLIGTAALHPSMRQLSEPTAARGSAAGLTRSRLALLAATSVLAPGVQLTRALLDQPREPLISVASATLFLLVLARLTGLVRVHEDLVANQLRRRYRDAPGGARPSCLRRGRDPRPRRAPELPQPVRRPPPRLRPRRPDRGAAARAGASRRSGRRARVPPRARAGRVRQRGVPPAARRRRLARRGDARHGPDGGGDGRRDRAQHPRRQRAHGARAPALAPGVPRPADRPAEPRAVPRPRRARRSRAGAATAARRRRALHRPRRLQDGQRHASATPRATRCWSRSAHASSGRCAAGDTVARLGGDEFAVLLEDLGDGRAAVAVGRAR